MAHVNDLDDHVDRLNGEVNRLNGGVEQVNGKSDRLASKVDRITGEIKRLSGEIMNIKTEIIKKFEDLATVIQTDFVSRLDRILFTNTEMARSVTGLGNRFEGLEEKQKSIINFLSTNYGYAVSAGVHSTGHSGNMGNAFTIPNYNATIQGLQMPTTSTSFSPPNTAYGQWSTQNLLGGGVSNSQVAHFVHANNMGQPQGVYGNSFRAPHQGWTDNNQSIQIVQASRTQAHVASQPTTNPDQDQNRQNVPGNAFSNNVNGAQRSS
jgi:hypothetical protein